MTQKLSTQSHRWLPRLVLLALMPAALAACSTNTPVLPQEGIGFREDRYIEITRIREYEACRDEALQLDANARGRGSQGAYLTSARVLEQCEAGLGETNGVTLEERMRVYALSIQNYFKGGDLESARRNLDTFKHAFPGHDLYFADGSSFIVTMEALLGRTEPWTFGEFAALNVNDQVKREMRRLNYWKNK